MKDFTNEIYNSWTILREVSRSNCNKRQVLCKCKCGREVVVQICNLLSGRSKNCLRCRPHAEKHGKADKHRLYSTWKSMRSRCNNPNRKHYKDYGGRGITVCKEWDSFETFLLDMESSYIEGYTLERINNDGEYSKNNCKWATRKEQSSNTRRTLKLWYNGVIMTERQLSEATGVSRTTIQSRRNRGASVEEMIYEPK